MYLTPEEFAVAAVAHATCIGARQTRAFVIASACHVWA